MQHLHLLNYAQALSTIWNYLQNELLIAAISNPEYMYHLSIPSEYHSPNKYESYLHAIHRKCVSPD